MHVETAKINLPPPLSIVMPDLDFRIIDDKLSGSLIALSELDFFELCDYLEQINAYIMLLDARSLGR